MIDALILATVWVGAPIATLIFVIINDLPNIRH